MNSVKQSIEEYVQKHNLGELMESMLQNIAVRRPDDVIEFLIEFLQGNNSGPKVFVIGYPKSGKKKIATKLKKILKLEKITYSDLKKLPTVKEQLAKHEEVSGDVIAAGFTKILESGDYKTGWIAVGFPRNREQALALQKHGLLASNVLFISSTNWTGTTDIKFKMDELSNSFKSSKVREISTALPIKKRIADSILTVKGFSHITSLCVLGPTGSGKTTLSQNLAEVFGLSVINLDMLLSKYANDLDKFNVKKILKDNNRVPETLAAEIVVDYLNNYHNKQHGFILDGFPNTRKQAQYLRKCGYYPDKVFVLDINDESAVQRTQDRLYSSATGRVYNSKSYSVPKFEEQFTFAKPLQPDYVNINETYRNNVKLISDVFQIVYVLDAKQNVAKVITDASSVVRNQHESLKIAILGQPLSGKTLSAKIVAKKLGLHYVNVSELASREITEKTELGLLLEEALKQSTILPADIGARLLESIMQHPRSKRGWVLDGYPQTIEQAKALLREYLLPSITIVLNASQQSILGRMNTIQLDKSSGIPYNLMSYPAPLGTQISQHIVQDEQMKTSSYLFSSVQEEIMDTFSKVSHVQHVNSSQSVQKTILDIMKACKREPNPLKVIIIGLPAIGKGTQCEMIKKTYGVIHLSTGDILREAVNEQTEIGLKAKPFMEKGLLVPDELLLGMLQERINKLDCKEKGFLLDGFPRTPVQAKFLVDNDILPDAVILLEASDQVVIDRISGRRTDPKTKNVYHILFNPPPKEIAQEVMSRWIQRDDDTEDKVKVRISQYHKNLPDILNHFQGMIHRINGDQKKEIVTKQVIKTLDAVCRDILFMKNK